MDNSLLVLVERLVLGEHRVVAVLGVSGLLLGGWSTTLVLIHQT